MVVAVLTVVAMIAALAAVRTFEPSVDDPGRGPFVAVPLAPTDPSEAAVEQDRAAGTPVPGGRAVIGLDNQPPILDPTADKLGSSQLIIAQAVYDPLTAYDDNLAARPFLAEALVPSFDLRTWSITLRAGVTFHDGTPCDAEAVRLALERFRFSSPVGAALALIDEITVDDPRHLRITTSAPWATLPQALTGQAGFVPAASVFQDFSHHTVIGTGPFVLDPWTEDGPRSAHRNPQYWRPGRPYLDSVTFKTVSETWDRWSALQDGEVDLIKFQGPSLERWAGPAPLVFTDEHQNPARTVFALNTSTGPFDDVTARRLLAVAIDRSEIDGGDSLGYLGRHSPLFSEDPSAVQRYDPVAARRLAAEYETAHGHPLRFDMLTAPDAVRSVTIAQRQLRELGVTMTITTKAPELVIESMMDGSYEAGFWLMFGGPSPETDILALIGESAPLRKRTTMNLPRFTEPVLLEPVARYRATGDPDEQRAAMADVQRVLTDQAPWIFLSEDPRGIAVAADLHGALAYTLPDGHPGLPTVRPFVGNLWRSP